MPLASPSGKGVVLDPVTWDLDRVEVLRGPQGVLFGSGSLGGAIRYLFNKPRMNEFEASVKAEYAKASGGEREFLAVRHGQRAAVGRDGGAARGRVRPARPGLHRQSGNRHEGRERHAPTGVAGCW